MDWQMTVLAVPTLFSVVGSLFLLGYVLTVYRNRRRDPLVTLYALITVAALVWTGFSALKLLHTDPATKLLFFRLLHIGAAALPPLVFLFVIAFTDRHRWLRFEFVAAVFLVPVVFVLLLFVEPSLVTGETRLIEGDIVVLRVANGPGFLAFSAYSVLLVVATIGVVLGEVRRFGSAYYPQALLIVVAVVTPMLGSLLTTAGIAPFTERRVNLVPPSAAVSVALFGVLLYRYRLVDLPPLAYATAMRYSPDALFVLDRDGRVVSTNDHGGDVLEDLNRDVGVPLSEAVPGFDPESQSNELLEVDPPTQEEAYYRPFIRPLTRGGKRLGWVAVLRDETEQQRQHQRLQEKTEQMELVASTISHDLRNPLTVASGYLQQAQQECESEALDDVENAHARMEEIIDDVLTLARAGKRIDTPEAVPVDAAVQRAWANVVTDSAALAIEDDRTIMADPVMVQHVFENLFRNAVEHGGEDVTVIVGALEGGVYVEDDGAGIPSDHREDIFEVGYTDSANGTGFGLSIVKQIINAHGWNIHVTEGAGGGARFEITGVETAE